MTVARMFTPFVKDAPRQPSLGERDPAMHGFISFDGNKNRGEF